MILRDLGLLVMTEDYFQIEIIITISTFKSKLVINLPHKILKKSQIVIGIEVRFRNHSIRVDKNRDRNLRILYECRYNRKKKEKSKWLCN